MSKAIPTHRVVGFLNSNKDETPSYQHLKPWCYFYEGNNLKPPVPEFYICGPIFHEQTVQFSVTLEENANKLVEHLRKSGHIEKFLISKI